MRKLYLALAAMIVLMLASCLPKTPDPPYGVWMSEEPKIVLYLKPEYRIPIGPPSYLGFYILDGVETKVIAHFGNGLRFRLYDHTGLREDGGISGSGLIIGDYRVVRNEIHYTLTPYFQEQIGVKIIIFHNVEDNYDPIDPYDWFPHFFPRSDDVVVEP